MNSGQRGERESGRRKTVDKRRKIIDKRRGERMETRESVLYRPSTVSSSWFIGSS